MTIPRLMVFLISKGGIKYERDGFLDRKLLYELYVSKKMTAREIAKMCGGSRSNVYRLLSIYGIPRRQGSDSKRLNVNVNFFKSMTPDLAYLLGLWATDGYIKSSGVIGIKSIDRDMIDWIKEKIRYTNKIDRGITQAGKNYYEIRFRSKEVEEILSKYGIVKHKTRILKFPNIPEDMLPHFIRGLFDGDGCIFSDKFERRYTVSFVSASYEFIQRYKSVVESIIGGDRKIVVNKQKDVYQYSFSSITDVKKFGEWIYQGDSFGIGRKKEIFVRLGIEIGNKYKEVV